MLNIVIPMAGRGSRFVQNGFTDPKPFISVCGAPMVELVINNLRPSRPHRFIFICQKHHLDLYDFRTRLEELAPGCAVIGLAGITEGAACTVLEAAPFIDNTDPLMIANADQWVNIHIDDYLGAMDKNKVDGFIMTMPSDDPKWSYVARNTQGQVTKVVEKEVVSDEATVGIYNFTHGKDFCRAARTMIADNDRSRGEYYVAPAYSYLYRWGAYTVDTYNIGNNMYGLGTPEDLATFLRSPVLSKALPGEFVE